MPKSCVSGVVGEDGRELIGVSGFEPASEKGLDYKKGLTANSLIWCEYATQETGHMDGVIKSDVMYF